MTDKREVKNMQFKGKDFAEIARLAKILSDRAGVSVGYVATVMYALKLLDKELNSEE